MLFGIPRLSNRDHYDYLVEGMEMLTKVRSAKWGIPELLMPSFEAIMEKSAPSFGKIFDDLFTEFAENETCGILIKGQSTIVYGFGGNTLYVWVFRELEGHSLLQLHFSATRDNTTRIYTHPTIASLYHETEEAQKEMYEYITNMLVIYCAVKKYVKVETIVVPVGAIQKLDEAILGYPIKDKVKNDSGQEVIIMNSRWFRKIINDNDIFVRGFWRFQNKKDKRTGLWYKELILIDSHIRHGYHRDAKVEGDV